jgi:hypothetical protein
MIRDGTGAKQQAMRINDSPDRLQTCSGASGSIETNPRGKTFRSARAYLSGATPIRSRAALPFFVCRSRATMI